MKNSGLTEAGRLNRNEYFRNYRKENRGKINEINQRFWLKKARALVAKYGK